MLTLISHLHLLDLDRILQVAHLHPAFVESGGPIVDAGIMAEHSLHLSRSSSSRSGLRNRRSLFHAISPRSLLLGRRRRCRSLLCLMLGDLGLSLLGLLHRISNTEGASTINSRLPSHEPLCLSPACRHLLIHSSLTEDVLHNHPLLGQQVFKRGNLLFAALCHSRVRICKLLHLVRVIKRVGSRINAGLKRRRKLVSLSQEVTLGNVAQRFNGSHIQILIRPIFLLSQFRD